MCYDLDARPPIPPISGAAADGDDIVLTAPDGNRFSAYMARSGATKGTRVLIFPDVRGLHEFYKDLALRFAGAGIPALAIDYFGRTAGTTPRDETFEYGPHVEQMTMPTFLNDVAAAVEYLRRDNPAGRVFIVGFCRGGTLSLHAGAEDFKLAGIIAFYAGLSRPVPGSKASTLERAAQLHVPVLGLFGGADLGIPEADVQQLDHQLDVAGVQHEIVVYPGATHSFFDRRYREFADASTDAWKRVLAFTGAI
ncbi:MAG TPA: dienelactone hydrolase family protein [Anaerolineae bacterium]